MADAPLYLQITRQLYKKGLLEHLTTNKNRQPLDTREVDRSTLRWRLLDTWRTALADGHLHPEIPLSAKDRDDTINIVSALACVGLQKDTLEVKYHDLIGKIGSSDEHEASESRAEPGQDQSSSASRIIWEGVRKEIWKDLYDLRTSPLTRGVTSGLYRLPRHGQISSVLLRLTATGFVSLIASCKPT